MAKDKVYWFTKLKADMKARIPAIVFRKWDPLTTWLEATGKRLAEVSAQVTQTYNGWFIGSARGAKLDRRLRDNEGVERLEAVAADDGTITLGRFTEPAAQTTFPVGSVSVAQPPDPSKPGDRVIYTNTQEFTIGPGATTWTVGFKASRGGADTNMPVNTTLQILNQPNLLNTAVVATAFTVGTDEEKDPAYQLRGRLEMRSRTLGTDEAIVAAALKAGATFAFTTEDFADGAVPVTLYAATADGTLSAALTAEISRYVNGDNTVTPKIPMARCKGIFVDIQPATTVTFNFSIPLVLQAWVVGDLLTALRADIQAAITDYVRGLNAAGNTDRTMRINRVKDIILNFRARGVIDVDNATFLPAGNTDLTAQQMAVMGSVTWL